jgi:2Fe-2S ferredoxin
MPKVIFVQPDGTRQAVELAVGTSVMQGALAHRIPGIVAECGGSMMCATCHVYVGQNDLERLLPPSPVENETLRSVVSERSLNSRLSCQLVMSDELDGIVVCLPSTQS